MKKSTITFLSFLILCYSTILVPFSFFGKFDLWETNKQEVVQHEQILVPHSKVSIKNTKGTISIRTWKKPKLLVEATKTGSEEEIRLTKIETLYTTDGASIKTVLLKPDRQCTIDYTIMIPQTATLSLVQTDKGDISITDVSTPITAHAEYGALDFKNISNSVHASTKNGAISIQAEALKPSSKIIAIAEKGTIKLQLPTDTNALLYAKTDKGTVTTDHMITLEPRTLKICQASFAELKRDVRGSLGQGGTTTIKLHTSRGNVKVLEA